MSEGAYQRFSRYARSKVGVPPKEEEARVGLDKFARYEVKAKTDLAQHPLAGWAIVVPDADYKAKSKKVSRCLFNSSTDVHGNIELYPASSSGSAEFKQRFATSAPDGLEIGVLHRLLEKEGRYVKSIDYKGEVEASMVTEVLYILGDAGAYKVMLCEELFKKAQSKKGSSFEIGVPDGALPTAVPLAGDVATSRDASASQRRANKVTAEYADQSHQSHIKHEMRWFFSKGLHDNTLMELIPAIVDNGGPDTTESTIHFSGTNETFSAAAVQAAVSDIVGVGVNAETENTAEYDKTLTVIWRDKSFLEKLPEWQDAVGKRAQTLRRSMAGLANLRTSFFGDRLMVREDYKTALVRGEDVPIKDWKQHFGDDSWLTWVKSWVKWQAYSNTFTVPMVLYGPVSERTSQVRYTWDMFIRLNAPRYIRDGAELWDESRSRGEGRYETFSKRVRFDPSAGSDPDSARAIPRANQEMYEAFSNVNVVRLIMYDTIEAKNVHEDVDGIFFPFGLQMLALDAGDVVAAYKASTKSKDGVAADVVKDFTAMLTPLLGDKRDVDENGRPQIGKLVRYPPMCTIVGDAEGMGDGYEERAEDAAEACVWLSETFGLAHVFPMPLLASPTKADTEAYNSRHGAGAFQARFRHRGIEAVGVLSNIVDRITDHEFKMWHAIVKRGKGTELQNAAQQEED